MKGKFNATVSVCNQIGIDKWQQDYYTKTFDVFDTMMDVLTWAQTISKNFKINDITFSVNCDEYE
jgi:hypothetical protein